MPLGKYDDQGRYTPGGLYGDTQGYLDAYQRYLVANNGYIGGGSPQDRLRKTQEIAERADNELNVAARNFSDYFKKSVGRDPTADEANNFFGDVLSGNDLGNISRPNDFRAIVQNYVSDKYGDLGAQERKTQIERDAAGKSGDVNDIYQSLLNRGASKEEVDHFGKLLASGEVDPYELRQFIQATPEYLKIQDTAAAASQAEKDRAARESLNTELTNYDQDYFNKAREGVISRFAQAGRLNSSSLDYALTDLMGQISKERSRYLADVARQDYTSERGYGREDYLANKGLLRSDYETDLNRMFADQDYNRARQAQLDDIYRSRTNEIGDYNRQRDDYMNFLRAQTVKRGGGAGGAFSGALSGAAVGGSVGGPWGAVAGGVGGGLFGYFNQ